MLAAAKRGMIEGGSPETNVIAITQLTSTSEKQVKEEQLVGVTLEESVINYAKLAKKAGLDGVVSSVWEAKVIKENCGEEFLKVTPGIRLETDEVGDQKRVATPERAACEGSTHIVVGRSITKAKNPLEVYNLIKEQFTKKY